MTPDEKRALFDLLSLDQIAYLLQMVIDGKPKCDREAKMMEFACAGVRNN